MVKYGFTKFPKPAEGAGSSRYFLNCGKAGFEIHLWAFGAAIVDPRAQTGIIMRRYESIPRMLSQSKFSEIPNVQQADSLFEISERIPTSSQQIYMPYFISFIEFITAYEAFIQEQTQQGYRFTSTKGWPHKLVDGPLMLGLWEQILNELRGPSIPNLQTSG
ncbi:MAG: hypothetical protein LAT67_14775 [Balneolales bacterium]|nr:hypothetical protein [Balneolales bacterium]